MNKRIGNARQLADVRRHFLPTQRAVDADGERLRVRDGIPKCLGRLARKCATGSIRNCYTHHDWQPFTTIEEYLLNRKQCRFEVQGIEGCFRQ